jgi:outer membrane protease
MLLAVARPVVGQGFTLTTSTSTGVILGVAKEFLYSGAYMVSELDWPLLPAVYLGAAVNLTTKVGFLASLELLAALPTPSGTMTDSDFLNGDGVKTHYSQSDGNIAGAIVLNAQLGWAIPLRAGGAVSLLAPFLAFEYMQFKWTARDGYYQYPPTPLPSQPYDPWSPSTTKTPIYGTGIIYTQNYYIPMAGIKGTARLLDNLTMSLSLAFSPYVWCSDVDEHIFTSTDYYGDMRGGWMLEPWLFVTYRITPQATLTLDARYRHIGGLLGEIYKVATGTSGLKSPLNANAAGASFDAVNVSLALSLSF